MDALELSDDVIEQIDHRYWKMTEVRTCYVQYGLCKKCNQPKRNYWYCNYCHFQPNFKNWTSGNHDVDEFIQIAQLKARKVKEIIEWIEYDKFEDVEYLAKGGFGTTFKAVWKDGPWKTKYMNDPWERKGETKVALKCLHNSQDIATDFLKEVESNILVHSSGWTVRCYGITKDPKTSNFIMVMGLKKGSLRQHLNNNFVSLNWKQKLFSLQGLAFGLREIHDRGLIHHDFHSGNILSDFDHCAFITDLGLCQPANVKSSQNSNKKVYGVLPYVAPEILKGKEYTQASDIYGYGIIAYEICAGFPPYYDIAHDGFLAMKICNGLRPKSNYKIPQLIADKINQCWDADPLKRPNADEIQKFMSELYHNENPVIDKQIEEADEINKKSSFSSPLISTGTISYMTHPQAVYTSRLLDFKNLPEPKNVDNDDLEYLGSLRMDFTKLDINSESD